MWIFSNFFKKTVDQIISREVNNRANEVEEILVGEIDKLKSYYNDKKQEYEQSINELTNSLQSKIRELENKHIEIEQSYQNRILKLTQNVETEVAELERVRNKAEEEQKRLWERLDILRDNLNTEDVWVKLWEMAYAKATDAVWAIMQKETLHLVDLAEQRAYFKAKGEFEDDLDSRMKHLIEMANDKDSIPFVKILTLKKAIEDIKLNAERVKNTAQVDKCDAQLEILGGLLE